MIVPQLRLKLKNKEEQHSVNKNQCIAVMYHYIRKDDSSLPHLMHLHVEDFEKQLDYFASTYGFVSKEEWSEFILNGGPVPAGVLLTFDDGLSDHYINVFRILRQRGLWGIFYLSTDTLSPTCLLNVHRVHCLLGKFGGEAIQERLMHLVQPHHLMDGFYDRLVGKTYSRQQMEESALQVKRVINYSLKPECKDEVLSNLMQECFDDEMALARHFYLSPKQINEMEDYGCVFGGHGQSHNLLTKFNGQRLVDEVVQSVTKLNRILRHGTSITYCYPYGGVDSYNEHIESILRQTGIRYAFAVDPNIIDEKTLAQRPLHLPRFDCNEFPHGQVRPSLTMRCLS